MDIRFWGVRGSIAVGGPRTVRTGGNTSCVELRHEGATLILDGGTGLRMLGEAHGAGPLDAAVLFSHVHWDHIQGVPFFAPMFHPESRLTLAGSRSQAGGIRAAIEAQMRPPTFPVTLDVFNAQLDWANLDSGTEFAHGPFRIRPLALHHPDGVLAYRVEAGGRAVVYATDNELDGPAPAEFVALCEGADLLVLDAQYTEAEYRGRGAPSKIGWGHSSWESAVDLGRQVGAGLLALFHHDPARSDDAVAVIEAAAKQRLGGAFAAREGALVAL